MPLLESGYRAAAKTELERDIRELEARDKAAQTRTEYQSGASIVQGNITFAQRLNLISQEQAETMKKRVENAIRFEQTIRNETGEQVDDIENAHERAGRYTRMESVNAEINQEKARAEAARGYESGRTQEGRSAPAEGRAR